MFTKRRCIVPKTKIKVKRPAFEKLDLAYEQHEQALQNFNLADKHHIGKAVRELKSAEDRLVAALTQAAKEVKSI